MLPQKTTQFIGAMTICLFLEDVEQVSVSRFDDATLSVATRKGGWINVQRLSVDGIEKEVADFQSMAYDFARKCAAQLALAGQPVSAAPT